MAGNFIPMVYAVLKDKGIDTKGMSTDKAVEMYNELVGKNGKYSTATGNLIKKHFIDIQFFASPGFDEQSGRELKKSLKSKRKNIQEHEEKIKNPDEYIKNSKGDLDKYREKLIQHWENEIKNFEKEIEYIEERIKNEDRK